MESTVQNIVSEEIQKMEALSSNEKDNDQIWEYEDQYGNVIESEEVLLEMERLLYKELREELIRRGQISYFILMLLSCPVNLLYLALGINILRIAFYLERCNLCIPD
jgi:Replication protein A interacting middle